MRAPPPPPSIHIFLLLLVLLVLLIFLVRPTDTMALIQKFPGSSEIIGFVRSQLMKSPVSIPSRKIYRGLSRLMKELKDLQDNPLNSSIRAGPVTGDMFSWQATIMGPPQTPYAGVVYKVNILFPLSYPMHPPKISFMTKIFHPNINTEDGSVCMKILKPEWWTPAFMISEVLLRIYALLESPNIDDSCVPEIAHMYKSDRAQYEMTERSLTQI